MRASAPVVRTAILGSLALTLVRCSEEAGPTGWIPRTATISGVIVPAAGLVAPLHSALLSPAGGTALTLPERPRSGAVKVRAPVRGARAGRATAPRAAATPGDLLVTFWAPALGAPPLGTARLTAAARAVGAVIRSHLSAIVPPGARIVGVSPAILTAKVHVADTTRRDAIAAALRDDPAVAAVSRNRLIWLDDGVAKLDHTAGTAAAPRTNANDPFYPFQSWHYGLIDTPRAWSLTTGSAAVLVAVVDDGIRFDHPGIAANLTSDGHDFVNDADSLPLCAGGTISNADDGSDYDPDPTNPASYGLDSTGTCFIPETLGGHGLHVAGTIGAVGNDGVGVTGVNWTVRIRPVRVLGVGGVGEDYDVAQGVLYAAGLPADDGAGGTVQAGTGARIINLSLGGPGDDPILHDAIISATSAGALIVAAAGNDHSSALFYPAAYPEVLAVAAVGPDGVPAPYSNFGSYVGIRAPGGNFDLGDATDGVASTMWDFAVNSPAYAFAEGTSMAAPHVSGVAALVLAQSPALTAAELRTRLTSYAAGPATAYGVGLVNAYNSLTQTLGPPTQLHARLYAATTGAIVETVAADPGGTFTFNHVEDGSYFVYGGADEAGDHQVGIPGRLWGALGGPAAPSAVTVLGAGPSSVSLSIGLPLQVEPNHTLTTANALAIGGYMQGVYADTLALDVYRVTVPETGTYTFETSGWVADCGFALEEATAIGLFDAAGNFITSAGYLDPNNLNFCSRLTRTLSRGTYFVAVAGAFNDGRYRLQARAGS